MATASPGSGSELYWHVHRLARSLEFGSLPILAGKYRSSLGRAACSVQSIPAPSLHQITKHRTRHAGSTQKACPGLLQFSAGLCRCSSACIMVQDLPSPVCPQLSRRAWEIEVRRARRAVRSLSQLPDRDDVCGGAMPSAVLMCLPGQYFSWDYLRNLAAVSRQMCACVRDVTHWTDSEISINTPEFQDRRRILLMSRFWQQCRHLDLSIHQLAMLSPVPEDARLVWRTQQVLQDRPPLVGVVSDEPLMGVAHFDMRVSTNVRGLYIGVKELGGNLRSYVRIDNLHTPWVTWSCGINESPPVPHPSPSRHSIRADAPNLFTVRWNQRCFCVELNGVEVTASRLPPDVPNVAPPLSKLHVWGVLLLIGDGALILVGEEMILRCVRSHLQFYPMPRSDVQSVSENTAFSLCVGACVLCAIPGCVRITLIAHQTGFARIACSSFQTTQVALLLVALSNRS